jgi:hypothetical protein
MRRGGIYHRHMSCDILPLAELEFTVPEPQSGINCMPLGLSNLILLFSQPTKQFTESRASHFSP